MEKTKVKVQQQRTAKDEYRKILLFLQRVQDNEPVDLKEMLKTYLQLFVLIKDSMENGSDSQMQESLLILSEFYNLVTEQTAKRQSTTGLSAQEILLVADNPNFFTPDQWKAIEEAKLKVGKVGMELKDLIYKRCY